MKGPLLCTPCDTHPRHRLQGFASFPPSHLPAKAFAQQDAKSAEIKSLSRKAKAILHPQHSTIIPYKQNIYRLTGYFATITKQLHRINPPLECPGKEKRTRMEKKEKKKRKNHQNGFLLFFFFLENSGKEIKKKKIKNKTKSAYWEFMGNCL